MRRRELAGWILMWLAASNVSAGAAMTTEERLRALENLVHQQQEEIKQLRGELRQQKAVGTATQQQAERAEEQSKAVEKKTVSTTLPDWINKFTPFGDLRLRYEGFFDQPTKEGTKTTARNRVRFRYRLGLRYTYSDELSVTARLASGNPNDPISTNETDSGEFTPKHVNLDWAFLTFTPGKTFGIRPGVVSFTGGKFPNPMFRVSELVFDDDLSPEGGSQTIQFLDKPCGALDQVKLHLEEWSFQEVSNGSDGWMMGGQVNPAFHLGNVGLEAGIGQYYWLNPNLIAQAANSNSSLNTTNLVNKNSSGQITSFQSAFNQTNLTLAATFPDMAGTMPLKLYGDYVYNWQAVNDDAHGLLGGVRLGNPKTRGDWAASLFYEYLMQEATIGDFSGSDFGNGGTNEYGPVIQLDYQLLDPLTLTARSYFTKYIDPAPNLNNRMQVRLQLDAMVKF